MITGNYRFLTLLSILIVHALGVLSHHAYALGIKKKPSFTSNLGNLEIFNQGGPEESPTASKIGEPAPKDAVATSFSLPSPPSQNIPAKKESEITDEELEFLLFDLTLRIPCLRVWELENQIHLSLLLVLQLLPSLQSFLRTVLRGLQEWLNLLVLWFEIWENGCWNTFFLGYTASTPCVYWSFLELKVQDDGAND